VITILVPVLNRPQNAAPLVESVRATCDYRVLFLCSPRDEAEAMACVETGEAVSIMAFENGPGDWARKINKGISMTTSEYVLLGADDLRFHEGWAQAALRVARETGAGVIGTNDLGNATVMRGLHSTHPLVRRSYIEKHGTIDEPGLCLHEGYAHQWVDTELIETAKVRGQWAFAADSLVEHLHPFWRKGAMDSTYEKALSTSHADHALFQQRRQLWSRAAMRRKIRT
jgi:glycosyltransferase involved in cell wall biosynthesis